MNVTRVNIDELNAVLKVTIEKEDYEKTVAQQLKEYRQKAAIPGFRPGKAPEGLVRRKFRVPLLVDEVNKLISKNLSEYMVGEKLHILGEPMPNETEQKQINWETDESFEFSFDIGLAPKVNLSLTKDEVFQLYKITVSEETIDKQVEMYLSHFGKNVPDEVISDNSSVRGDFVQLDETGNPVADGIQPKSVLIAIDMMKNDVIKNSFIGKKKDDAVVFDPVVAYENRHEVKHMLNISEEAANELNSNFSFTVTEVLKFEKAELTEETFKQIYGEETEIKTAEDFRNRIKAELESNLSYSANQKFAVETRDKLIEQTNLELPEAFLKRWLQTINKELSLEQIENEFGDFLTDLKWQLIKDTIAKENNIEVTQEETKAYALNVARSQFYQYGMYDIPEERLESFANMILEKPEESERIYRGIFEGKVLNSVKEKVTIQETPVSQEEFSNLK